MPTLVQAFSKRGQSCSLQPREHRTLASHLATPPPARLQQLQIQAPSQHRSLPTSGHTLTHKAPLALSLCGHSRNFSFQITLSKP